MSTFWWVLEAAGAWWAVAEGEEGQVRAVERTATGVRLQVAGRGWVVQRVVARVENLAVTPPGSLFTALWGQPHAGLAVYGERPLVVLDPQQPPRWLLCDEGEPRDGQVERSRD